MPKSQKPPDDTCRSALEATIAAAPVLSEPRHAAIVALARTLADQVDRAGPTVATRLTTAYLSSLKDLRRAVDSSPSSSGRLSSVASMDTNRRSWRDNG